MRALKPAFLFFSLAVFGGCQQSADSFIVIKKTGGETLQVRVEVADTPALRSRGLMFREELPEGTGMLFVFPAVTSGAFWMKNTPIPLDLIFVKAGAIVALIENAVPFDETPLSPGASYTMALEVPGGYASRHGVRVGDGFEWRKRE
ncbi:MAG TPA: DUF192 domain-containing protein [bacterium]|nr:DUF192 domain-containing protein [bacterium]